MANVKPPKTKAPKLPKVPGATKVSRGKQVVNKTPISGRVNAAGPKPGQVLTAKPSRTTDAGYYAFTGGKTTRVASPIRPLIP